MTDTLPFTSEFVCNNLARKVVRGLDAVAHSNAVQFANDLLLPIAERLTQGKMQRGVLKPLLDRMVTKLTADPHVVSLECETLARSKLSANEHHRLVFVLASAVENSEDWVTFIATEVVVSRKELNVISSGTDFRIHRHALAKYMHRELLSTERMMGDLSDALHASALLGTAAVETENRHVAIPMKDGMLFGRIKLVSNAKSPSRRARFRINRHKPEMIEEDRETLMENYRAIVEIMTYVDWNSLTPSRERLHVAISQFMNDHAVGMKHCFNAAYYETTIIETERSDATQIIIESMTNAIHAARALVKSPEWRAYETSVGANG